MSPAPRPTYRLVPSQFPPVAAFEAVATAADLPAVLELEGWTNDRLVADRMARLPRADWVFGRPNASVVMAAFLHLAPGGMRFNGPDLGAWYAGTTLDTSIAEVAHHLRREAVARGLAGGTRRYRIYSSSLSGDYDDIRGQEAMRPDLYDAKSYAASQNYGEALRAAGGAGVIYGSLRLVGGIDVVCYRPPLVLDVTQSAHVEVTISTTSPRIDVVQLM